MTKTLTYSAFVIASLLIVLSFVTAQTYSQLALGVVLYAALNLPAFGIFPRSSLRQPKIAVRSHPKLDHRDENLQPNQKSPYVADIDKRTFIKLIGATGISFFLFSLLGRRVETLLFGKTEQLGISPQIGSGDQFSLSGALPADGYKISEIDEGLVTYYGFINKEGAWIIMREDYNENNFRYAKGGSDLPGNWQNRENLRYDYYHKLF